MLYVVNNGEKDENRLSRNVLKKCGKDPYLYQNYNHHCLSILRSSSDREPYAIADRLHNHLIVILFALWDKSLHYD